MNLSATVGTGCEPIRALLADAVAARGEDGCGGALHADDALDGVVEGAVFGLCELAFGGEELVGLLELELLVLEGLDASVGLGQHGAQLLFFELERADGGAELIHFELLVVLGLDELGGELLDDVALSPLFFGHDLAHDALGVGAELVGPFFGLLEARVDVEEGGLGPLLHAEDLDGHAVLVLGVRGLQDGHVCEERADVLDFEAPEAHKDAEARVRGAQGEGTHADAVEAGTAHGGEDLVGDREHGEEAPAECGGEAGVGDRGDREGVAVQVGAGEARHGHRAAGDQSETEGHGVSFFYLIWFLLRTFLFWLDPNLDYINLINKI